MGRGPRSGLTATDTGGTGQQGHKARGHMSCVGHSQDEAPMKVTGRPVRRSPWEPAPGDAGLGGEARMQGRGTEGSHGQNLALGRGPGSTVPLQWRWGRGGGARCGDWLQSQRRFCAASPTVAWPGRPHAGLPVLRRSSRGRCRTLQGQEGRVLHACEPQPGCLFLDGLQRKNGFYTFSSGWGKKLKGK